LEKARYEMRALRRIERDREAARALRRATPDWVQMREQLIQLELEVELDAMAACIDERRLKIPILDKAVMAKLRAAYSAETPIAVPSRPTARDTKPHPDVKIAADWRAAEAARSANENHPPPPGGKVWKYDSPLPGRRPEDDWRNWE
jgi:hypothetical protein